MTTIRLADAADLSTLTSLIELFVMPEERSLNIGAALLEAATTAMAQRGIKQIQLQLGVGNACGQRLYEQQGFETLSAYRLLHKSLPL